jgi:hypothetical protein
MQNTAWGKGGTVVSRYVATRVPAVYPGKKRFTRTPTGLYPGHTCIQTCRRPTPARLHTSSLPTPQYDLLAIFPAADAR